VCHLIFSVCKAVPYSDYIRKMSTCEKRHKKRHKNGSPLFFVSDFRFLHSLPTGKGKKADIYQKRRFAFVPLFCRNISYIISVSLSGFFFI
jgi:hypothetical protein